MTITNKNDMSYDFSKLSTQDILIKHDIPPSTQTRQVFSARGVVVHNDSILLVSRDEKTWHLPGGWIEHLEPSSNACIREIYEECGISVSIITPIYLEEKIYHFINKYDEVLHRFDIIFLCQIKHPDAIVKMQDWIDEDDGLIKFRKFFNNDEWKNLNNIHVPSQLKSMNISDISTANSMIGISYER